MDYVDRKTTKDRSVWDTNIASFHIIEEYPEGVVCHNVQRSFLGGLVAARDFCVLYTRKDNTIYCCSVTHPDVPVTSRATRGTMHFTCFHCEDESRGGENGFRLTYICQVDIGGSLSPKLLYNGTMDNLEKMVKVFKTAKKVFN